MTACLICKGSKIRIQEAFTYGDNHYPEQRSPCSACHGQGEFPEIDAAAIVAGVTASQGKNKGKIRAAAPKHLSNILSERIYYVWRLARFHGGVDMTMPMTAELMSRGDPFRKELDRLADQVAKDNFGSNMRAARAWGQALGF